MTQISISKSYAVLMGIEGYALTKKQWKDVKGKLAHSKNKLLHPHKEQGKDNEKHGHEDLEHLNEITDSHVGPQRSATDSLGHKFARRLQLDGTHEKK